MRDEKIAAKLSQMMDHSIKTHQSKYTFVNTAKEVISAVDSMKQWRIKQCSEESIKKEEDEVFHEIKQKRKWTREETSEVVY